MTYSLRILTIADIPEMQALFRSTVLHVNKKDYTQEEVEDWASCGKSVAHWQELLAKHTYIGAFDQTGIMIGFSSMNKTGYLHSMFVHKDWQNKGVATQLLAEVERIAQQYGVKEITSDISITACPFFEHKGYRIIQPQLAQANQLRLKNYKMRKLLG